jgi:hypothetical protein
MRSILDVSIRSGLLPASMLLLAVACQASNGGSSNHVNGSGADGQGATSSNGASGPSLGGALNLPVGGTDGNPVNTYNGKIKSDAGANITVGGETKDVHLQLFSEDGTAVSDGITWSVDDTKIGSISGDGTFHAGGYVGGVVTITATIGNSSLSVELTVDVDITTNDGKITDADQTSLIAGGSGDATFKFLYPYDGTVFPRGLASPLVQLAGTAATATYTTITLPHFKYQQFSQALTRVQVKLPEPVWKGMTLTAGAADDVTLTVSKLSGGTVSGPATQTYRIAQASMKGIIYYNTYSSPLTNGTTDTDKGGILRIRAGSNAEVVQRGCTVCHAVSSKGTVLATGFGYDLPTYAPTKSQTYDLAPDGTVTPRMNNAPGLTFPFAGLTPDGTKALTNGLPPGAWPTKIMRGVYSLAGYTSSLVDTKTGTPIAASISAGGTVIKYVQTPSFSPDSTKVAFLNGDMLDNRVLSTLDFDNATNAFSTPNILVQNPNGAMAWPTFLPDNSAVVFHAGDSFDSYEFTGGTTQSKPQYAEVQLVETATKTVKKLEALNGRNAAGTLTLPYGETVEGRMNYEPNVLPVAVGGYYWVIFDSRRAYGNTIAPGGMLEDVQDPWGSDAKPSLRKKLWIAAIDVDHMDEPDPSHPAFYLPGQELEGGNMRAFAAMAPCQPDGGACESGSDCCGGFCRQTSAGADGAPMLACVPPPTNTCPDATRGNSQTDEACVKAEDCCDPTERCINARCTLRSPPK